MLVLSRKINEEIVIGKDVTVRVISIRGDKVRLGIIAPPSVPVNRREIQNQIDRGGANGSPDAAR